MIGRRADTDQRYPAQQSAWLIRFITTDSVQRQRVTSYRFKPPNCRLVVSEALPAGTKHRPSRGDVVYVLPAEMLKELPDAVSGQEPLPAIAYGNPLLLKRAFAAGAWDYLKEPWTADEFWSRAARLIEGRRKLHRWGDCILRGTRLLRGEAAGSEAAEVELSLQEAVILKTLLANRGRPVSRQTLFYALWGRQPGRPSRVADVHVASLRKKLRRLDGGAACGILTVRGVGYLLPESPGG